MSQFSPRANDRRLIATCCLSVCSSLSLSIVVAAPGASSFAGRRRRVSGAQNSFRRATGDSEEVVKCLMTGRERPTNGYGAGP